MRALGITEIPDIVPTEEVTELICARRFEASGDKELCHVGTRGRL